MNHRERQIVCGLFLSKFDQAGLKYLGFESFTEAFNALGYSLKAKPASIKNYRDELDPLFPNQRKGWHKRPLREHCRRVLDRYSKASIAVLGALVQSFLLPETAAESLPEVTHILSAHIAETHKSFAQRLITGKAAEQYFVSHYAGMKEFANLVLTDTTAWGCGFDFKLSPLSGDSYVAVEVKGLRSKCGQVQMTELEHDVAGALGGRYFLVLVRNFAEQPFHTLFENPANSRLKFTRVGRRELRFSWTAKITA
jgi:hypothetical protein